MPLVAEGEKIKVVSPHTLAAELGGLTAEIGGESIRP